MACAQKATAGAAVTTNPWLKIEQVKTCGLEINDSCGMCILSLINELTSNMHKRVNQVGTNIEWA